MGDTHIEKNAFYILGATTRDNKHKIMALAEEKSLELHNTLYESASTTLINPRHRLAMEIAWFPCLSPERASELIKLAKNSPQELLKISNNIPALALANLIAIALEILDKELTTKNWVDWIIAMAEATEKINVNEVFRDINKDRAISGFPAIKDPEYITTELAERNRYYKLIILDILDTLPLSNSSEIVNQVVDMDIKSGRMYPLTLINDIVDGYELRVQKFLDQDADEISKLIKHIKYIAPQGQEVVMPELSKLDQLVHKWYKLMRSIQQNMSRRGIENNASKTVAYNIRELGIFLANEYKMVTGAAKITQTLQAYFKELYEVADIVNEDAKILKVISAREESASVIAPIISFCDSEFKIAADDPQKAILQGQRIISHSQELLWEMQENLSVDAISCAQNYIAMTVMQCAIVCGKTTNNWSACRELLESATTLATEKVLIEKINANLIIVNNNLRAKNNAPILYTVNGCGFMLYGATDQDLQNGSYITTYYFVFLFLPIFPISRYRVIQHGNGYRFLEKFPLRTVDKWHLTIAIGIIAALFLLNPK